MAFGMQDTGSDGDSEVMNEINMTPLVDVMLVLLIIFIITVPVMKHAVNVELPTRHQPTRGDQARNTATQRGQPGPVLFEPVLAGARHAA